jgi:hypothetical protein
VCLRRDRSDLLTVVSWLICDTITAISPVLRVYDGKFLARPSMGGGHTTIQCIFRVGNNCLLEPNICLRSVSVGYTRRVETTSRGYANLLRRFIFPTRLKSTSCPPLVVKSFHHVSSNKLPYLGLRVLIWPFKVDKLKITHFPGGSGGPLPTSRSGINQIGTFSVGLVPCKCSTGTAVTN